MYTNPPIILPTVTINGRSYRLIRDLVGTVRVCKADAVPIGNRVHPRLILALDRVGFARFYWGRQRWLRVEEVEALPGIQGPWYPENVSELAQVMRTIQAKPMWDDYDAP